MDDTESKPETTVTTSSESSAYRDSTDSTSAEEEKDTSETTTIKTESSQSVSSASKPVSTEKTAVPKSGSSNSNGNPNHVQNNSVQNNNDQEDISQKNDHPAQNNQQRPDDSPSDNSQSNNETEQNDRPSDNKPQNPPPPSTTSVKPVVTDPPDTAAPKPQTTVPPTEPPAPEPTEKERYMDIGRNLLHDGSDYSKAEAVYNWMTENGSGTCVNYSWQTYYLCKGVGIECYLAWTPSKLYGHVANVVKVNGTQFILDTQGQGFLMNNDCGFSEIIDIDESYISSADVISSQRYDEVY